MLAISKASVKHAGKSVAVIIARISMLSISKASGSIFEIGRAVEPAPAASPAAAAAASLASVVLVYSFSSFCHIL